MLTLTYVAEIWGELTLTAGFGQVWMLPFLIYLDVVNTQKVNKWVVWGVTSLLLSYPNGLSSTKLLDRPNLRIFSTSNPSRLELTEHQHSPITHCFSRMLQYVCSSQWYNLFEYLSCRLVFYYRPDDWSYITMLD